ncbi:MAG TPA: hypothetical protein VM242_08635 [Acidimicrobiales bacterium]|jgi:hypothetical protein|nr:hypothetical protein [Acidimicrobiales bacterium]
MVGNLAAHRHPSPPEPPAARALVATGPETAATMTLEVTPEQLDALLAQSDPARRHTPTDLVVTVDGRAVGVFRVVASLLGPAPPAPGKGAA